MLKQPSTLRPFMRQPIVLMQIASGASNHDVVRGVCATTRKRYDVFNMIRLPDLAMAIVTASLLPFVLRLYIGNGERSGGTFERLAPTAMSAPHLNVLRAIVVFVGFTALIIRMTLIKRFLRSLAHLRALTSPTIMTGAFFVLIGMVVIAYTLATVFQIGFTPFLIVLISQFGIFPILTFAVLTRPFSVFGMLLFPLLVSLISTHLAPTTQAERTVSAGLTRFIEVFGSSRIFVAALRATFHRSVHSVFPSLYSRLLSASGGIIRRSGATLADIHIIPQTGGVC